VPLVPELTVSGLLPALGTLYTVYELMDWPPLELGALQATAICRLFEPIVAVTDSGCPGATAVARYRWS
jgi:sensor c-di-GMP phosphodiesterase-like protein